jgi:hypothetical protein
MLAELADGTPPSTVARKVGVGYATVARIAGTTKRLPPDVTPDSRKTLRVTETKCQLATSIEPER